MRSRIMRLAVICFVIFMWTAAAEWYEDDYPGNRDFWFEDEEGYYFENHIQTEEYDFGLNGGRAAVLRYKGNAAEIAIPGEIEGYPVIAIVPGALDNCAGLQSVHLPDSFHSIDGAAFSGYAWLQSVTIPDSVAYIGVSAFSGCAGLTSVTIPDSVTYIDMFAFYDCANLQSVIIPASVTVIEDGVYSIFEGCGNVTLYVAPGSYAEAYAQKHSIPYHGLEDIQ